MSDENDDTTANGGEGSGIANLRKEFENLKKQLRERDEELNGLRAEKRTRSVADVLKAKGVDETKAAKAASLYNGADASEEAVGKWLEDFGDVFGLNQQAQQQDAQQQAEIQRVQQAAFGTQPSIGQPPANAFVVDPVEALAAMQSLPYEQLVQQGYLPDVTGTMWDTHAK